MRNIKDKKTLSLTQAEKQALSELLSFLKTKWSLARFILFGSKVRGTSDKESDLDLLIILPCKVTEGIRRQIIHKVFEVNLACGSNISILIVSAEEWEKGAISVLPIHAFIRRRGFFMNQVEDWLERVKQFVKAISLLIKKPYGASDENSKTNK